MKKLTAEKCREQIAEFQQFLDRKIISTKSERHLEAYLIALPVLEQQERECDRCGGNEYVENVIPLKRSEHVTLTKRQYRQLCNAYINAFNCKQQVLMIHRGDNRFSDCAVWAVEDLLQAIIRQLKEVIDGENDVLSQK